MANTYTQIYIQVVFAVQGRYNLIRNEYKEEYFGMLEEFNIAFDTKSFFKCIEDMNEAMQRLTCHSSGVFDR